MVLLLLVPFSADVENRIVDASICSSKSSQSLKLLVLAQVIGLPAIGTAGGRNGGFWGCLGGRSFGVCWAGGVGIWMGWVAGAGLGGGCRRGVLGLGTGAAAG